MREGLSVVWLRMPVVKTMQDNHFDAGLLHDPIPVSALVPSRFELSRAPRSNAMVAPYAFIAFASDRQDALRSTEYSDSKGHRGTV